MADHGAEEGAILDGIGGPAPRGQGDDADPMRLRVEQRRGHAGHLAVQPEGEDEADIAGHDGGNPAVVGIERGREFLSHFDSELELSLRGTDPDGHPVAGEEAAQSEAEPIEDGRELHGLVELGHQIDQCTRLAVAALQLAVLLEQLALARDHRVGERPDASQCRPRQSVGALRGGLLQAIAGQAADYLECLALRRGPVPGQPEACQAGGQQQWFERGHDGLTRPPVRNGNCCGAQPGARGR